MTTVSEALATFILTASPEPGVRDRAMRGAAAVLDAADRDASSPAVRAIARAVDSAPELGIRPIMPGARLPVTDAATVNGAVLAAGASTSDERVMAAVLAAVLAHTELSGAAGEGPLVALTVGVEVGLRMADAVGASYAERGWDPTGIAGSIGAAAAGARLADLSHAATMQALGVAATQGAGLRAAQGSDVWALHVGRAAANGLEAALQCGAGFSGPAVGIEGRRGFMPVAAPGGDPTRLTDELGAHWRLAAGAEGPAASQRMLDALAGGEGLVERVRDALSAQR